MGFPGGGGRDLLERREDVRQANFLELFVDLVLVFALSGVVTQVARDATAVDRVVQWRSLAYLLVLALPLIWLWITTAHITSWFDPRRRKIQWVVLASAFGLLVMASSLPYAFTGKGWSFVLPYVVLHCVRPLILLPSLHGHALRDLYARSVAWCAAGAGIWVAGALVSGNARAALWAIAITVDIVAAQLRWPVYGRARPPVSAWAMDSGHHLPERYQQLLMIALGETVLAVGITFTDLPATTSTWATLVVAYLSTVLLWRIYFYRSGQVLAEAVAAARDRLAAGRATGIAHVVGRWHRHHRRGLRDRPRTPRGPAGTSLARDDPWRSGPVPLRPHPAGTDRVQPAVDPPGRRHCRTGGGCRTAASRPAADRLRRGRVRAARCRCRRRPPRGPPAAREAFPSELRTGVPGFAAAVRPGHSPTSRDL
nr:low temperature requirement protein A [Micromonospora saelicesensis]